ncbi:hypothetical protein IEI94_21555 [Halomonas sp. ML-15]|uniref:hypothetical protein n=1 Tax=Halomonas sp. ML-15 TaxID=2773305 RepID=UPI0017474684|nr:hypothetical protein [Halomonas sp. ML-15]MBD3898437.1 hypothetical protein [Halomonas sp. ML-15]
MKPNNNNTPLPRLDLNNHNKVESPEDEPGRDAPCRRNNNNRRLRGAPSATITTGRRKVALLPSWLDYCFEYETVATRKIDNNKKRCLPADPWLTVVRIQGDAPSRRKIISTDR